MPGEPHGPARWLAWTVAVLMVGTGCAPAEAPPPPLRLVAQLDEASVSAFPAFEELNDDGLQVTSLMGMDWTLEASPLGGPAAPSPTGGLTSEVHHVAPPALGLRADARAAACLVSPWVHVLPRTRYTLMGFVRSEALRAEGPLRGALVVEERSELGTEERALPSRDGSTGWTLEKLSFESGPMADDLRVRACLAGGEGGSGGVWFDEVALVRHPLAALTADSTLSTAEAHRLARTALSHPWRHDVAEATRPPLGRDAIWGDDPSLDRYRRKLELAGEAQSALLAPPPTWYRFPVPEEGPKRLRVAFGVPDPSGADVAGTVSFLVGFDPEAGERRVLMRFPVELSAPEETGRWHPVEVALPGEPGELVLGTTADPGLEHAAVAFGDPVVLAPRSRHRGRLVLLVSLDTLRADAVGAYGAGDEASPHLDRLASRGVLFENAHAPSPWTLPSHRTLMTGLQPLTHGSLFGERHTIRSVPTTLGEHLQAAGFATVGIHGEGFVSAVYGFAEGFDRYIAVPDPPAAFDEAIRVIREHADRDLFLFLHTYQVHAPYVERSDQLAALGPRYAELKGQVEASPEELGSHDYLTRHNLGKMKLGSEEIEMARLLYQGGLRFADELLAGVLEAIEEEGLDDEALIVVTSDHGEGFAEHDLFLHANSLYGEHLRVPLVLVHPPSLPAGRRVTARAATADLLPTILDLLEIPPDPGVDGRSLLGVLEEGAGAGDREIPASLVTAGRAVLSSVRGDRKYIVSSFGGTEELYDLAGDPTEKIDLAQERAEDVAALRRDMLARLAQLPGLHLVAVGDGSGKRLTGSIETPEGRASTRLFFSSCAKCIVARPDRVDVALPLVDGPLWINLPNWAGPEPPTVSLRIGDQPVEPAGREALLAGELAPGLYRFQSAPADQAAPALTSDALDRLEALGYLE